MNMPRPADAADFTFISSAYSPETFRLLRFEGREGLSELFGFELTLVSEIHDLNLETLIDERGTLTLHGQSGERSIHGIVMQAQHLRVGRRFSHYQVQLVPTVAILSHTRDLRIFQAKTTREIIDEVIRDAGLDADSLSWRITVRLEPRDYCVQYRESSLSFICRLLEEEGIFFYFDHHSGRDVMILSDTPSAYRTLPIMPTIYFRDESNAASMQEEVIYEMTAQAAIVSGKTRLRDYRFKHPGVDLTTERAAARFAHLVTYDYPGNM